MRKNYDFSKGKKNPYSGSLHKEKDLLTEDRIKSVRNDVQKGIDQADIGELIDGKKVMDQLHSQIKKRKT